MSSTKLQKNNNYFNIAGYAILSCFVVLIGLFILMNLNLVWHWITNAIRFVYGLFEPLIIGLVIAYLLDPIVNFYEVRCLPIKKHKRTRIHLKSKTKAPKERNPRTMATFLTFLTLLGVMGVFILMICMNIEQVAGHFSIREIETGLQGYLDYFENMIKGVDKFTASLGLTRGQGMIEKLYEEVNQFVLFLYNHFINSLVNFSMHVLNWLLAIVVSFYLLQDKKKLLIFKDRCLIHFLKPNRYQKVKEIGKDIDVILSGYIRGEIIDSIIIMILTSAALLAIHIDFAIIIGVIAGIFNLIPYFGPIVGLALAVIIGLLDPNPMKAIYGAIAILIIQQIDGWFIVPKVVGECVQLHPIIVLLAILIGGNLFGLVGMLLAVPVTALIRVLLMHMWPDIFAEIS